MADYEYEPVRHDHDDFLEKAYRREGFKEAYEALEDKYSAAQQTLRAQTHVGSDFDDFLRDEGMLAEAEAVARIRVISFRNAHDRERDCDDQEAESHPRDII